MSEKGKRNKKKKKKIEGECYFCKQELKNVDKTEKMKLSCCDLVAHKNELYKWFLQNQHCPRCLVVHKQTRSKIVQWGMNKERPSTEHVKTKRLVNGKRNDKRFEKRLR
ncbi:MAG: hypothetical protein GOP50_11915 [Candidatus Heimdallarchaeota archaeon]|nr:hypothetical protein [Candidatus Heimdallarchaeota archaeon]